MRIVVKRIAKKPKYTIGKMSINDCYFCDTLEDTVRNLGKNGEGKVFGETAIPAGTYKVIYNWSERFKRLMPRILDVPFFDGILIHNGANPEHTQGCVLVGLNKTIGGLSNSNQIFQMFINLIEKAVENSEEITITIE